VPRVSGLSRRAKLRSRRRARDCAIGYALVSVSEALEVIRRVPLGPTRARMPGPTVAGPRSVRQARGPSH
jgi:hypothetical protein